MTRRALVLDLDDTLYRERRFALGGFAAVASDVERRFGIPAAAAFAGLCRSLRAGRRAGAFQELSAAFGLPPTEIPRFVAVYRGHAPRLRLSRPAARLLEHVRSTWRLAVVTNGLPAIQARKVRALGLEPRVDLVVYAEEHGGKPAPGPFLVALDRLQCLPSQSVFVGDDPLRDIAGASRVGMRTVLLHTRAAAGSFERRQGRAGAEAPAPDAVVSSLAQVAEVAERVLQGGHRHVH